MSKTYVLIYRSYDYHEFNHVLHAGTLKQCMKQADKIWKKPEQNPACYINKIHFGKVYFENDCPGVDNSFLLVIEFEN